MPVSANTLFHFTKSIDNLISILKYEFKPNYHIENALVGVTDTFRVIWAVPMVCFCDLPLSMVRQHIRDYGPYALGMSKKWGIKKGLNPVMYLCRDSDLCNALGDLHQVTNRNLGRIEAYIKPYDHKELIPKTLPELYYDEREWRYVPKAINGDELSIGPDVYTVNEKLMEASRRIGDKYRLSFTPEDIKYIIVEKESQRDDIIDAIEYAKQKYPQATVRRLTSRILSSQQIKEDF